MPLRQSTAAASLVLAAALGAGCKIPMIEAGNAPAGPVRDHESELDRRRRSRAEEARHAAKDAAEDLGPVDASGARTGSRTTRMYHRADCAELKATPGDQRQEFKSVWDALDAEFAPCPVCRPGP